MTWIDGSVSIATAAERLGIPCSAVWHQIVEGRLQAYTDRRGSRVFIRVVLPDTNTPAPVAEPAEGVALTNQVVRLTATVDRLTALLDKARCSAGALPADSKARLRPARRTRGAKRAAAPADSVPTTGEIPPLEAFLKAAGPPQALRPNPMTHPIEVLAYARPDSRDDLLEPVRQLFEQHQRQWWQRLPLVSRG